MSASESSIPASVGWPQRHRRHLEASVKWWLMSFPTWKPTNKLCLSLLRSGTTVASSPCRFRPIFTAAWRWKLLNLA
jgi:hypothetical protein